MKFVFRPGLRPGPRWGSSRRSPSPANRLGRGKPPPYFPSPRRLRRLGLVAPPNWGVSPSFRGGWKALASANSYTCNFLSFHSRNDTNNHILLLYYNNNSIIIILYIAWHRCSEVSVGIWFGERTSKAAFLAATTPHNGDWRHLVNDIDLCRSPKSPKKSIKPLILAFTVIQGH